MQIKELIWDSWNERHIGKKGFSEQDIYDVCVNVDYPPLIERSRKGTLAVWGCSGSGKYLLIILAPRSKGSYYPVTARPMEDRERRRYQKWQR